MGHLFWTQYGLIFYVVDLYAGWLICDTVWWLTRCCWSWRYDGFSQTESYRGNDQQLWPDTLPAAQSQFITLLIIESVESVADAELLFCWLGDRKGLWNMVLLCPKVLLTWINSRKAGEWQEPKLTKLLVILTDVETKVWCISAEYCRVKSCAHEI